MGSENNFEKLIFLNFCQMCEKVSTSQDRKIKVKIIKEYINSLRAQCPDANFQVVLRCLLPNLDRERCAYGIKEYNLAKTYIRILDLPKDGKDATTLLHFRSPLTSSVVESAADFANVAYWILKNKCGESSNIELGEVNKYLDRIAEEHAAHNPRAVDDILIEMLRKMSALEQKWLMRLILKSMHLGLGNKAILELYHPDSMELYDVCNSLPKICTTLKNPNVRLHELEIKLFVPFRPMLSERCDISKIDFNGEYIIDEKLDGERFQIHYSNEKFKYFSRNAFEFTDNFGEDKESGYYTCLLAGQIKPDVKSFILDGEMMGWHTTRKCYITKANNIDVKKLRLGNVIQTCFCAFDVVYFNDNILTNKALEYRLTILEQVFEPLEGVIAHTPRTKVKTNEEILKALNTAIDKQLEGIIVKQPNSLYKANSRNSGWYKIKPEYTDGALVELDLIIIGGYFGEGKRKGNVNQFLLGLATPKKEGSMQKYCSLCRVGSGYTVVELGELLNKINPHWHKFHPNKPNEYLLLSKEKPDLWIEPNKSYILQVKASEVVRSDLYHFGYTLRFPRVERVRYDKSWEDCLTTLSFAKIVQEYSAKLTYGHVKRKRNGNGKIIDSASCSTSNIKRIGEIFNEKEICVLTGDGTISKSELETMIVEQGGTPVNAPGLHTYCIIAGDMNVRVRNIISASKHIVVSPKWLLKCIELGTLSPFNADYVLAAPQRKRISVSKIIKVTTTVTHEEKLKSILESIPMADDEGFSPLPDKVILELENKVFSNASPYSIFRNIRIYFYKQNKDVILMKRYEIIFEFLCGKIDENITDATNYVVLSDISSLGFIKNYCKKHLNKQISVLNKEWIMDCFSQKQLINTIKYTMEAL